MCNLRFLATWAIATIMSVRLSVTLRHAKVDDGINLIPFAYSSLIFVASGAPQMAPSPSHKAPFPKITISLIENTDVLAMVRAPPLFTRDSIYAIARICHGNSDCPSVRPSVTLN